MNNGYKNVENTVGRGLKLQREVQTAGITFIISSIHLVDAPENKFVEEDAEGKRAGCLEFTHGERVRTEGDQYKR